MIDYTIFCDVCGEMIDSDSRSARQARKRAKVKNLLVRIARKDYCPPCAEKLSDEEITAPRKSKKNKMNFGIESIPEITGSE